MNNLRSLTTIALGLSTLLSPIASLAAPLLLNEYVSLKTNIADPDTTVAVAFRTQQDCKVWKYIPGRQYASGPLLHLTGTTPIRIGDHDEIGLLTSVEMATRPGITKLDLEHMKAEIARYLSTSTGPCADKSATAASIFLSPALVVSIEDPTKLATSPVYSSIQTSDSMGGSKPADNSSDAPSPTTIYRDPTSPSQIALVMDATNKQSEANLRRIQTQSLTQPYLMGYILYGMEGILTEVDSTMSLEGEFTAAFDAKLETASCNISNNSKSINDGMVANGIASSNYGGGHSVGYTDVTTTCNQEMKTFMTDAASDVHLFTNHHATSLSVDGNPLMMTTCDSKMNCNTMSLEDYLNQRLYADLLRTNFDFHTKLLADRTYDVTIVRRGKVKSTFKFTAEYLRRFDGHISVKVPIYATKLPESDLDFEGMRTDIATCSQKEYLKQQIAYKAYGKTLPLPIATKCLQ